MRGVCAGNRRTLLTGESERILEFTRASSTPFRSATSAPGPSPYSAEPPSRRQRDDSTRTTTAHSVPAPERPFLEATLLVMNLLKIILPYFVGLAAVVCKGTLLTALRKPSAIGTPRAF
jgi:hypothetical protein